MLFVMIAGILFCKSFVPSIFVAKHSSKANFPKDATHEQVIVFVNTADSASWEKLPGIGAKLSARIIKYRNIIGGFSDLNQLSKVYGLKPETFERILPSLVLDSIPPSLRKKEKNLQYSSSKENPPHIDIRIATAEDFGQLPRIGKVLGERIVKFRNSKKNGFRAVTDIRQVYGIDPETFEKILPYLYLTKTESELAETSHISAIPENTERTLPEKTEVTPPTKPTITDLNTATAEALVLIPGIGEKTAQRILEMRSNIGGFARVEHINAVWGITPENYERMKSWLTVNPSSPPQKKSLNHISAYELSRYPFMQKNAVSQWITYRKLNGYFKTWEEVENAEGMSPKMLEILKEYFVIKP